eukprot:TRINITY_DN27076_c0_g2_i1.p2 TRINITY_DN27076_c0_g2~~TRINITY_DN27076_c0_g2_i1.p2  ORF type:complete len:112 (-),score=11.90 TRINITY_DN27076_c0_g2_i1:116-451(-)
MECAIPGNLLSCSNDEIQVIEYYRQQMMVVALQYLERQGQYSGAWMPACIDHGYSTLERFNDITYEVPMNSGNTLQSSLQQWYLGQKNAFLDFDAWPHNTPCDHITSSIYS